MTDGPVIVTSPTLSYVTKETTPLCEATKDLLLWMRAQGFGCTHLEATEKGGLTGGPRDDFPIAKIMGGGTQVSQAAGPVRQYDDFPDR